MTNFKWKELFMHSDITIFTILEWFLFFVSIGVSIAVVVKMVGIASNTVLGVSKRVKEINNSDITIVAFFWTVYYIAVSLRI